MREFFIKLKNLSIITIVASLAVGIVLLIKPAEAVQFVSIFSGAIVILLGAGAWISYLTKFKSSLLAVLGTLAIIAGVVLCVKYKSIISVVIFLLGIFVLVSGVVDFGSALDAKRNGLKSWLVLLLIAVITIILGIIVVVNPFDSVIALTRLLGIGLIVYSVMDLISFVQVRKIIKFTTNEEIDVDAQEHTEE
jgi:uncharacterized membrane protein HdeD (DUF308 family)